MRYSKYNKKPPLCTALDDLWSLEKKGINIGRIGTSQSTVPSNLDEAVAAIETTDVTTTDITSDDDIPPGISFDKLHPPSLKIPKGGKIKRSKEVEDCYSETS